MDTREKDTVGLLACLLLWADVRKREHPGVSSKKRGITEPPSPSRENIVPVVKVVLGSIAN